MPAKGKWAQGIKPRHFQWVIQDRLAICERPGGYGASHRRVRRQEEIIWVREQGLAPVISTIPSSQNLHNYDELGVSWLHRPFPPTDEIVPYLGSLYPEIAALVESGNRVLVHHEEMGDRLIGLMAGYLLWSGMVPEQPKAIFLLEHICGRQLGPTGREIVTAAGRIRPAAD